MKKLIILLFIITTSQADDCSKYANNFRESIDDIKMAIELKSKDEAKFFIEEAHNYILDINAACSKNYRQKDIDIKSFRKILNQYKDMVIWMN